MMNSMVTFPEPVLRVFTDAIANNTISLADRYQLMSALLDRDLQDAELAAIDQLIQTLQPSPTATTNDSASAPVSATFAAMAQQLTNPWEHCGENLRLAS